MRDLIWIAGAIGLVLHHPGADGTTPKESCAYEEKVGRDVLETFRHGYPVAGPAPWMLRFFKNQCPIDNLGTTRAEFEALRAKAKEETLSNLTQSSLEPTDAVEANIRTARELFGNDVISDDLARRIVAAAKVRRAETLGRLNSVPDCETKDFRSAVPKRWNQRNAPWCYATAVAGAAGFALGQPVSVADVVSGYLTKESFSKMRERTKRKPGVFSIVPEIPQMGSEVLEGRSILDPHLDGGQAQESLEYLVNHGACLESDWRNEVLQVGGRIWNVYDGMRNLEKDFARRPTSDEALWRTYHRFFPKLAKNEFTKVVRRSTPTSIVRNLGAAACHSRVKMPPLSIQTTKQASNGFSLPQEVQKALRRNTIVPLTIPFHEMLIVGQHVNAANKCVFVVRNSWSKDCGGEKSIEALGGIAGSCQDGHFEMAAERLADVLTVTGVTTFSSQSATPVQGIDAAKTAK